MAPCGWIVDRCGCGTCWDGYSPAVRTRAQDIAAFIMWAATGRRYGLCPRTVMPAGTCAGTPDPDDQYRVYPLGRASGGLLSPVIDGGRWYNRPGGGCCTSGCALTLDGPTTTAAITAVTIAGQAVDPGAYQVQDGHLLVRIDGQCWPCCNNYADPGAAFTVTYGVGAPLPAAVQSAFVTLACEVAKGCAGGTCTLPRQMTRLTRQGVDLELATVEPDQNGLILTGIKVVDDVIRADNPFRLTAPPMVLSPDVPRPRRVT